MVHGLALQQDTRPWCLRRDRDQCCATYLSNGAVAAITAGAGTQYSFIGAALLTRMAPALCTRPQALAPRSGWRRRMYSATDVAYTKGLTRCTPPLVLALRSRLASARCAHPLALVLRSRLTLARCTRPQALALARSTRPRALALRTRLTLARCTPPLVLALRSRLVLARCARPLA